MAAFRCSDVRTGCDNHTRFYARTILRRNRTAGLLWAPAQRKRATMLYFANVFYIFFMAALFSGPG